MARRGAFPGSFNPPTVAHLAIAEQARRHLRLDRLDLILSRRPLAKEHVDHPRWEDRLQVITESIADLPWLRVAVTDAQLLVDIAKGYEALIIGADKWWQIQQIEWYESERHRDRSLADLPPTHVVPRHGFECPNDRRLELDDKTMALVSSTRARDGELELMTPAARRFARRSGAWVNPEAYETWRE